MASMKYRSVKTPPVCGSISLKDSVKSARVVRRDAEGSVLRSTDKKVGSLLSQGSKTSARSPTKNRGSNGSRTNSKGAGKR